MICISMVSSPIGLSVELYYYSYEDVIMPYCQ